MLEIERGKAFSLHIRRDKMKNRNLLQKGLIGGGLTIVLGGLGIVIVQGLWAVTQTPGSISQVMFGS